MDLAVLQGAQRILEESRSIVLVESETRHDSAAPECIFNFFAELGYFGYVLSDGDLMPAAQCSPHACNLIFKPQHHIHSAVGLSDLRRQGSVAREFGGSADWISGGKGERSSNAC